MADIELVIKIPEEIRIALMLINNIQLSADKQSIRDSYIEQAIINGTPLPKGHGRLIDIGKCDRKLFYQQCGGADSLITVKTAFDMLLSLPTIIEADKEQENEP